MIKAIITNRRYVTEMEPDSDGPFPVRVCYATISYPCCGEFGENLNVETAKTWWDCCPICGSNNEEVKYIG